MRGSRDLDNQRIGMNLPVRANVRGSNSTRISQEKSTGLSDLSPSSHFDSGTVSDMDLKFESGTSLEEEDEEESERKITSTSQTWSDSGINLDSGLGIESMTSDLDLKSPTSCTEKFDVSEKSSEQTVESGVCVYQDNDGDSPLHLAVVHGDPHLVFRILALYPEYLNVTNHLSQTALHLAVMLDFVRIVRRLVVCGAHLHVCDHRGDTPLHLACRLGHMESLKALTIPVIPKEVQEAGLKQDPLPQALLRLNPRLLQQRNYEGLTCTHLAVARSHKVLEYILQCGADINAKEGKSGKTVLHLCVEKGHVELVRFLLSACKAEVNARNYAQHTPLHLALLQKRYRGTSSRASSMVRLLRDHGGEPHDLPVNDSDQDDSDQEEEEEED